MYTVLVLGQPTGMSKEACLYANADLFSSSSQSDDSEKTRGERGAEQGKGEVTV